MEPVMKKAKSGDVEINLAQWEGPGKTILCIHGLTANCRCWDVVAASLVSEYNVLAMELRGRGHSGKPETGYSIDNHCLDIKSIMEDLGLKKVILLGHSLGASITLAFGSRYPELVEKIVLFDGGGKLSEEQMGKVLIGIKPSLDRLGQVFPDFEAYLDLMKQAPFLKPWSRNLEVYFQHEVEVAEGGICSRVQLNHIQEEIVNMKAFDVSENYNKVQCPALILRADQGMMAEDDLLLPEDVVTRMLETILLSQRVEIPNVNHYTIMFNPSPVRDNALQVFLAG
jgi:pimeloyl-ACP methyl ester carboxylesterase